MALGNILIRADASFEMGSGHVMRCLALAQAWRRAGGTATFLMAATTAAVKQRLQADGFEVLRAEGQPGSSADASSVAKAAREQRAQWLVLDGYQFGAVYRESSMACGSRLLLVDD